MAENRETQSVKSPHRMGLIIVGSVAVASFLIATLYTQVRLSELDAAAIKIDKIASPSLSYLTNTKKKA